MTLSADEAVAIQASGPSRDQVERELRRRAFLKTAEAIYAQAVANGEKRLARIWEHAIKRSTEHGDNMFLFALTTAKQVPVTFDEFIESQEYFGEQMEVWPALRKSLRDINADVLAGEEPIYETYMGGATGCHARGTLILMFDGTTRRVEDVREGDCLMGPDSRPRTVLALARGRQAMYRITPHRGGEPFVVNADHILPLRRTARKAGDLRAGETACVRVRDYLSWTPWEKHLHKLHRTGVEFAAGVKRLHIPPYILGVWLGDGHSAGSRFTSADPEIVSELKDYSLALGLRFTHQPMEGNAASSYGLSGPHGGDKHRNWFLRYLDSLKLRHNKHIPHRYLTANRHDRLELLAGLIDTDGNLSCNGYEITQKRDNLADDILFLARSLGFRANKAVKTIKGVDYFRVFVSGEVSEIPVRLERKRAAPARQKKDVLATGFTVEELPEDEFFGFALDGDHLYLTADFTVHHNTGKTARAHAITAYQLYCLTCFKVPQAIYGLTAATPLVFLFQSPSTLVTKRVLYTPFRNMFLAMPYAKKWLTWDKRKESTLDFAQRLTVVPALAGVEAMLGQAVAGGIFDEINFMSVIENSKQVPGLSGQGGEFDQAHIVHSNVTRRRKRSIPDKGPSFGVLNFMSSTRYKGDFLDRRMEQAIENQEKHIYCIRDKQYDVNPRFAGPNVDKFRFLVGTDTYAGRVLKPVEQAGEHYPENAQIELIPTYYLQDFLRNPEESSRDVIGVASLSITPFITQRHKIISAVQRFRDRKLKNWIVKPDVDMLEDGMPQWDDAYLSKLPKHVKERDWYLHVDLSRVRDRCGIAGVSIMDQKDVLVGEGDRAVLQRLPCFETGFTCSIKPSPQKEIDIPELRAFLMLLKTFYGINIVSVTFDGFDSAESIRYFRSVGIRSGLLSVDRTMEPYVYLRDSFYDDRHTMTEHDHLRLELTQLEHLQKKKKVDHPPKGCFTGETRVALADGTLPTFKELVERYGAGEEFYVYSIGPEGVRIAQARNPRITKIASELIEVTLDNFQVVRCTPDHLFMTLDGDWVRAENLTPDISIMPLYRSRTASGGWAGYERLWCPVREERLMTHHVSFGAPVPEGFHIHHRDENKANNAPWNLELLSHEEHTRRHASARWEARREAMRVGHSAYYENEENRDNQRRLLQRLRDEGKLPEAKPCAIENCETTAKARGLCDLHYQRAKRAGSLPERTSKQKNHRILSIRRVEASEAVYDLTVPETENFALAAGVFVHNSKDVSDALCGATFAAGMSRDARSNMGLRTADGQHMARDTQARPSSPRPRAGPRPSVRR